MDSHSEDNRRPPRERRLPPHLDDYQVGYQPLGPTQSATRSHHHSQVMEYQEEEHWGHMDRHSSSHHQSVGSRHSKPRTHVSATSKVSVATGLSDAQAAVLDEKVKRMELEEMKRQLEEESVAEEQCRLLIGKAREALKRKEALLSEQAALDEEANEAHRAREAIAKQLLMQRRLKEKEIEVEKASLITSFLTNREEGSTISKPRSEYQGLPGHYIRRGQQDATSSPNTVELPLALNSSLIPHSADSQNIPPQRERLSHPVPTSLPYAAHPALDHDTLPSDSRYRTQRQAIPRPEPSPRPYPLTSQIQSHRDAQTSLDLSSHTSHSVTGRMPSQPDPRIVPATNMLEQLIATSYGIPKPALPYFSSGKESDFALLRMALDSLLSGHTHLTEQYKYQILLEHLKLPSAHKLAQAFMYDPKPYTAALQALQDKYGQPRQLVQSELGAILNFPPIKMGDPEAFDNFALSVQSLVGMLRSLEGENGYELRCGSHVDRLLSKLPPSLRDSFIEYSFNHGMLKTGTDKTYTLGDFSKWLQVKSQAKRISSRAADMFQYQTKPREKGEKGKWKQAQPTTVYYNTDNQSNSAPSPAPNGDTNSRKAKVKMKPYCPYCNTREHYLGLCTKFKELSKTQITEWIKEKGCWRCGRNHTPDSCTLKKPCRECKQLHLTVLHDVSPQEPGNTSPHESENTSRPEPTKTFMVSSTPDNIYIDRPNRPQKVMLKVVKVNLHNEDVSLEAFAVLDDGSERTIILPPAVQHLRLTKEPETLPLRTVRHNVIHLQGASVSFEISPAHNPRARHKIQHAFTAKELSLSEHSHPVKDLMRKYSHLQGLPIPPIDRVRPLVLIGSDFPHLLIPTQPVRFGPPGGPLAVCTPLGWALQGPAKITRHPTEEQQCLFTTSPNSDLLQHVERLWKIDTLPYTNLKTATRSKDDKLALEQLEQRTVKMEVDGITRYATPLLRRRNSPALQAPRTALLPMLRNTERRIAKDAKQTEIYCQEIQKLEQAGHVKRLPPETVEVSSESWYLPHHLVHHNGKSRLVFNCSYQYGGQTLNSQLLPGPILGPSLLGVLLRFREHAVAISGDIKAMFHQIRLLPEDKPLLRFLWRAMKREEEPSVCEWQVLPFGTTCSPCCATYALQRHVKDNSKSNEDIVDIVERAFYVDNCLYSLPDANEAKHLIDRMRQLLAAGGFEIRQWASNIPTVVEHLPAEARASSTEQWLSQHSQHPEEPALGLRWNCLTDNLGYRNRLVEYSQPTLRIVYKVMASQYDPLGYLTPYSTRAKVLVQDLWKAGIGWDEQLRPKELLDTWKNWEEELADLPKVEIPRCYIPPSADSGGKKREAHIFCDASERAYGAVSYLRTGNRQGDIHTAFVLARSRVSPRKQLSIPRLELCAALTGAQLAKVIASELSLTPAEMTLWTDSTTVLAWLNSESSRYKVFVGTRVAEIQELTEGSSWRYINTADNPADDLTRGKTLHELRQPSRWSQGPGFLLQPHESWPTLRAEELQQDTDELRKTVFCGTTTTDSPDPSPTSTIDSWAGLIKATHQSLHGVADNQDSPKMTAAEALEAELHVLKQSQFESFPEDVPALAAGKSISNRSRLSALAPEYDAAVGLLRVGGRLRRATDLDLDAMHPIILDPNHHVTRLLIKEYDNQLLHSGPERVFSELRRKYWILRGRESVKRHQSSCTGCRRWRATPVVPQMADLPPARLRLYKPPFYSTGVDCFGPFTIKIGRRTEKRWGIIFKCMTTSCVHLDLLESIDTDAFLMALRRFISRRGKPFEILSDRGTNFRGGDAELRASFTALEAPLQEQLVAQQIVFRFNPPASPHFGGTWEREIRSVKTALRVVLGDQTVTETVLQTVLIEVEGILNAKPLGYVSSDVADPDPVTPSLLLMGRRDASLPQAIYASSDLLGRRRWRHSQILADQFWSNFVRRHLPDLQKRPKWQRETDNLTTGQVVMVVDPQLPRAHWPIGKVVKVCPGVDGCVRAVEVKIKEQTYLRPVARLVRLPPWEDDRDPKDNAD